MRVNRKEISFGLEFMLSATEGSKMTLYAGSDQYVSLGSGESNPEGIRELLVPRCLSRDPRASQYHLETSYTGLFMHSTSLLLWKLGRHDCFLPTTVLLYVDETNFDVDVQCTVSCVMCSWSEEIHKDCQVFGRE